MSAAARAVRGAWRAAQVLSVPNFEAMKPSKSTVWVAKHKEEWSGYPARLTVSYEKAERSGQRNT